MSENKQPPTPSARRVPLPDELRPLEPQSPTPPVSDPVSQVQPPADGNAPSKPNRAAASDPGDAAAADAGAHSLQRPVAPRSAAMTDAASRLRERGLFDVYQERARWFEDHALRCSDESARSRTLLLASELWAMTGNLEAARAAAERAAQSGNHVAQRQTRQLAEQLGDVDAVDAALSTEMHAAPTRAARTHAAYYHAERLRLRRRDRMGTTRALDHLARTDAADPRPGLHKLARQLGTSSKPPSYRWNPAQPALAPLERATRQLSALRAETRTDTSDLADATLEFFTSQRALERGERHEAAQALQRLAELPGFARTARWLAAALLAPDSATRPQAAALLSAMLKQHPSPALRRTLAARAVELSDADLAGLALREPPPSDDADPALGPLDQLAIATLCRSDNPHPWLEQVAGRQQWRPLARAVASALGLSVTDLELQDARVSHHLNLARALTQADDAGLRRASQAAEAATPLRQSVELELAARETRTRLVEALQQWVAHQDERLQQQARLACGVWLEQAGQLDAADAHYLSAVGLEPYAESAVRAVLDRLAPERRASLLEALAQTTPDGERRALLLLEASDHATVEASRRTLAEAAQSAAAQLPFAERVLLQAHLRQERSELVLRALEQELERVNTPFERAIVMLRSSLAAPGTEREQRRAWLERAWQAWPRDAALLEELEALEPTPVDPQTLVRRAERREQVATSQEERSLRGRLLLEAALAYEAAGRWPEAARVAEVAARSEPLARRCFTRVARQAPLHHATLREQLESHAETAATATERAEYCLALARLEAEDPALRLRWLQRAVQQDEDSLEALLELEAEAFTAGDSATLALVEARLARRLSDTDRLGHALLAARFEPLTQGWAAAYPHLKLVADLQPAPLLLTRQLAAHARRCADDPIYYASTLTLKRAASQPLDAAMLLVRAAETAVRLERPDDALHHLDEAVRLAPQYLTAHGMRAELLQQRGELTRAAAAYERIAQVSRVPEHQCAAFRRAAQAWAAKDGDLEQAVRALERALEIEPRDDAAFEQLLRLYQARSERSKLTKLLARRLEVAQDRGERTRLRLAWCQVLLDAGEAAQAKGILDDVLAENPEDLQVLRQYAQLAQLQEDTVASERALLQLARLSPDAQTQADNYLALARLYEGPLPSPERAARCYQEVLKRRPDERHAFTQLVRLLLAQGEVDRASACINQQSQRDSGPETQRAVAQAWASWHEYRGNHQQAESTYQRALRQWPLDRQLLLGLQGLYQRRGQDERAAALLAQVQPRVLAHPPGSEPWRDAVDAVIALAEAQKDDSTRTLAQAARQLLQSSNASWAPALGRAMSRNLDDWLAPSPIGSALRTLLIQTRAMLDRAFELDVRELKAEPLPHERVQTSFRVKAQAIGMPAPELFISAAAPYACWVTNEPARVVLGHAWVQRASPADLDFLCWRSLKLIQARVAVLSRLEGAQLLATLEAFLGCFAKPKRPLAPRPLVVALQRRLQPQLPEQLDDDFSLLALEALEQLEHQPDDVGSAVRGWANRCALLATGDLRAALSTLCRLADQQLSPTEAGVQSALQLAQARDLVDALFDPRFADAYRILHE